MRNFTTPSDAIGGGAVQSYSVSEVIRRRNAVCPQRTSAQPRPPRPADFQELARSLDRRITVLPTLRPLYAPGIRCSENPVEVGTGIRPGRVQARFDHGGDRVAEVLRHVAQRAARRDEGGGHAVAELVNVAAV